jgi:UDP-N-acetylglucosamine acyltransferase
MTRRIHPTAVIEPGAELAADVTVGPHAVIGAGATIGAGTHVRANAVIHGCCRIGRENDIHPGAVIGGEPQDLKYRGEPTCVEIGDNNIIRECVTVNAGTEGGGGRTRIGSRNLVMAYVHLAHDCDIGDDCILTNGAQLAGHIRVEDRAIISGMVAIHHFVTIGSLSFVAGLSAVRSDVPPFMIAEGNPARVRKLNVEGLRRRGMDGEVTRALKEAFRLLYRSEMSRAEALAELGKMEIASLPAVRTLLEHYRASEAGFQGRALEAHRTDRCRNNGNGNGNGSDGGAPVAAAASKSAPA